MITPLMKLYVIRESKRLWDVSGRRLAGALNADGVQNGLFRGKDVQTNLHSVSACFAKIYFINDNLKQNIALK